MASRATPDHPVAGALRFPGPVVGQAGSRQAGAGLRRPTGRADDGDLVREAEAAPRPRMGVEGVVEPPAVARLVGWLARRPRLVGAVAVAAVAVAFVALQPLSSPWWTGGDADSTYVASGLRLFAGQPTKYFDHPGVPLQEAAAAVFTVSWAVDSHGKSRAEAAQGWLWNLDSTRPYLRTIASVLFVGSALLVFLVLSAVFGRVGWGVLGSLLFLGSPDLLGAASILRPDGLVAALCVAGVG